MLSPRRFSKLLRETQDEYKACWGLVQPDPDPSRMDLLAFQPRLLKALQQLELEYQAIARAKRSLVGRKARLNARWFRVRMRTLAARQEALRDVMTMGRAMGDSFAWLFYREEHRLLDEHAAQPPIVSLPTGIGAEGELAFVSTLPGFAGHLVLHHGITTILRLGDVSLIDIARSRVAAIAELKTSRNNPRNLDIHVSLIWAKGQEIDPARLDIATADPAVSPSPPSMRPAMVARLQRQLNRTAIAIRPESVPAAPPLVAVPGGSYAEALGEAIRRARCGRWITHRAGPGLLFVVYRSMSRSLDGRVREMATTGPKRLTTGDNPSRAAVPLIIRGSLHNSLITGSILYGPDGQPYHPRVAMPLVWLGVDREVVFRLITLDIQVVTVYNPAHLYVAFERKGWEMTTGGAPPQVVLRRRRNDRTLQLHGLDHFVREVVPGLATEEQVVSMVELAWDGMDHSLLSRGGRIELDFRHVLPPLDLADPAV